MTLDPASEAGAPPSISARIIALAASAAPGEGEGTGAGPRKTGATVRERYDIAAGDAHGDTPPPSNETTPPTLLARHLRVPEGTETLYAHAFGGRDDLETVELPASLRRGPLGDPNPNVWAPGTDCNVTFTAPHDGVSVVAAPAGGPRRRGTVIAEAKHPTNSANCVAVRLDDCGVVLIEKAGIKVTAASADPATVAGVWLDGDSGEIKATIEYGMLTWPSGISQRCAHDAAANMITLFHRRDGIESEERVHAVATLGGDASLLNLTWDDGEVWQKLPALAKSPRDASRDVTRDVTAVGPWKRTAGHATEPSAQDAPPTPGGGGATLVTVVGARCDIVDLGLIYPTSAILARTLGVQAEFDGLGSRHRGTPLIGRIFWNCTRLTRVHVNGVAALNTVLGPAVDGVERFNFLNCPNAMLSFPPLIVRTLAGGEYPLAGVEIPAWTEASRRAWREHEDGDPATPPAPPLPDDLNTLLSAQHPKTDLGNPAGYELLAPVAGSDDADVPLSPSIRGKAGSVGLRRLFNGELDIRRIVACFVGEDSN